MAQIRLLCLCILIQFVNVVTAQNTSSSLLNDSIINRVDIVYVENPLKSFSKNKVEMELFNYTFAVAINNIDFSKKGKWVKNINSEWIWILKIKALQAKGLSLDFDSINLKKGDIMYIFNSNNNINKISNSEIKHKNYSSDFFSGDSVIVEYNPIINDTLFPVAKKISLNYAYNSIGVDYGFGTSGDCEINANCINIINYMYEKRSVVRIRTVKTVNGNTWLGWCTGTIIGNTTGDYTPFVITADHCFSYRIRDIYRGASKKDLEYWKFYFNYESDGCDNPYTETVITKQILQGATYKSNSGTAGDTDSDFCLLELIDKIPNEYNVFWAGWDNRNIAPYSGYAYHHPMGDIKKINTFSKSPLSSRYDNRGMSNTHWKVYWERGVTEAGSSGSSLLNTKGQIVGILTGGGSSCYSRTSSDFYGKFSYSWTYKQEDNTQLKHWLDPINSGENSIVGYDNQGKKRFNYNKKIMVYPNPISDNTVNLGNIDPSLLKEIIIYNINGKELFREVNPNRTSFKVKLTKGLYFINTYYNKNHETNKILIIR